MARKLRSGWRVLAAALLPLLPYLGHIDHPLTDPLEEIRLLFPSVPVDLQLFLIPFAAVVMGAAALVVQFHRAREWLQPKRVFSRAVLSALGCVVLLLSVYLLTVEHKEIVGGETASILVGFSRPDTCIECEPGMSDAECLDYTTLGSERILSCWSVAQIRWSAVLLSLSYLGLVASLGLMIGIGGRVGCVAACSAEDGNPVGGE